MALARMMRRGARLGLLSALAMLATGEARAQLTMEFPSRGAEQEVLSIHAATDLAAMRPLILDFQEANPGLRVVFVEYVTNDLYAAAADACRNGRAIGDILLSSSVDQLVRLANDGCAHNVDPPSAAALPRWAKWRGDVFGFTFEPVVFAYNRKLVPPDEVPRTHLELADQLRLRPDTYRGRVGTYDIRLSGIGYLLAFNDALQTTTTYGRLLEGLGRAGVVVRCCTSEILDEVEAGRLLIGYNMLASYAYARMRAGADIGIIMPADYTLVLSRGAMISAGAPHLSAASRFLDYLLSPRGQTVAREKAFFFGLNGQAPPGIEGATAITETGIGRPIAIGPALLAVQDDQRRARFLSEWSRSMIDVGPAKSN